MEFRQSGVPSNQKGTHLSDSVPSPGAVFSESPETLSVPATGLFDFGKALGTIMRRDRAGIQPREPGVVFKDLRVVGLRAATSYQPTFGSFFNPKVITENIQARAPRRHPALRDSGSEGIGKCYAQDAARFRKRMPTCAPSIITLRVKCIMTLPPEYVAKHYCGDIVYSPEDDIHFPKFRVDEILRFAAKMRASHNRLGLPRSRYVKHIADIAQTIFGLRHVKNTPVGDAAIQEIAAWDKLVFPPQFSGTFDIISYHSSTRGLDASTALEFVRALRIATDVRTYQLSYFDRTEQARQYFIDLGLDHHIGRRFSCCRCIACFYM
ncbi:hypothetical protein EDB83DRAFT_2530988 [Lactarius deliciosus]|nr:hypothetical protein EDB83DRAFT_2530988 [Lactarius deliciosus]